jgi:hypothetical protein
MFECLKANSNYWVTNFVLLPKSTEQGIQGQLWLNEGHLLCLMEQFKSIVLETDTHLHP